MQVNVLTTAWFIVKYISYEIYYYILGARAIIEDIIYYRRNYFENIPRNNDVAIVTGGGRGLGLVVVKKFLEMNMRVVIGCRNPDAGREAMQRLRAEGVKDGQFQVIKLDMTSFDSINEFAKTVLKDYTNIHILVNNAGIMFPPYVETVNGYESQWGVNFMGHYYLTHLLLERMKYTGTVAENKVRIVNVSSCAHFAASDINFRQLNDKTCYIPSSSYAQSKLAQVVFTQILNKQLVEEGAPVEVFAVHPGIVDTDIFDGTPLKILAPWLIKLLFKTPEQGSYPILYASLSPRLNKKGGTYISNCRISPVNKVAEKLTLQTQLNSYCKDSVGIERFGQVKA